MHGSQFSDIHDKPDILMITFLGSGNQDNHDILMIIFSLAPKNYILKINVYWRYQKILHSYDFESSKF